MPQDEEYGTEYWKGQLDALDAQHLGSPNNQLWDVTKKLNKAGDYAIGVADSFNTGVQNAPAAVADKGLILGADILEALGIAEPGDTANVRAGIDIARAKRNKELESKQNPNIAKLGGFLGETVVELGPIGKGVDAAVAGYKAAPALG